MNEAHQTQAALSPRQISEEQMKRYFSTSNLPTGVIIVIIFGAILLLIAGLSLQSGGAIVLGLVICLIGVGILVARILGAKPTDAEYDAWQKAQADKLLKRTIRKLGIDRQITKGYLQVHGFVLSGMSESYKYRSDELRWKKGTDGRVRFSVNVYTYFFPTDHYVVVFIGDVNALNQSAHNEKAEEYFYRDIVGVTTSDEQDFIWLKEGQYQYRMQRFSLRISNSDTLGVSVNASPLDTRQNLPSFTVPDSGIDNTVAGLRRLLHEADQGEQPQGDQQRDHQPWQEYNRTNILPENTRQTMKQGMSKKSSWWVYVVLAVIVLIASRDALPNTGTAPSVYYRTILYPWLWRYHADDHR